MFFPKTMTEVELIVPAKDLVAVTKVLGSRGSFHQIDSTYLGIESLGPNTRQEKAASYSTLERRIQAIMQTLNLEESYSGTPNLDATIALESFLVMSAGVPSNSSGRDKGFKYALRTARSITSELLRGPNTHTTGFLGSSRKFRNTCGTLAKLVSSLLTLSAGMIPGTEYKYFDLRKAPTSTFRSAIGSS